MMEIKLLFFPSTTEPQEEPGDGAVLPRPHVGQRRDRRTEEAPVGPFLPGSLRTHVRTQAWREAKGKHSFIHSFFFFLLFAFFVILFYVLFLFHSFFLSPYLFFFCSFLSFFFSFILSLVSNKQEQKVTMTCTFFSLKT